MMSVVWTLNTYRYGQEDGIRLTKFDTTNTYNSKTTQLKRQKSANRILPASASSPAVNTISGNAIF